MKALRLAVGYDRPGPLRDTETLQQAHREFRAMQTVVRAARRMFLPEDRGNPGLSPTWKALDRALARLDRLTK